MRHEAELRSLTQSLEAAQNVLRKATKSYPVLEASNRALRRIERAVSRPPRIAILGEANSGKSSLANLLADNTALPALPVANTRLPTLLQYEKVPRARALYINGERNALSVSGTILPEDMFRVEVGLPSVTLKAFEILDFPGSANPLFPTALRSVLAHGIDAAIWVTVATQAWRETERDAWLGLPERIRSRGLLAVAYCDLISTGEDFRRLHARLAREAERYFRNICFVAMPSGHRRESTGALGGAELLSEVQKMAQQFSADRLDKAILITRRLAGQALEKLGV